MRQVSKKTIAQIGSSLASAVALGAVVQSVGKNPYTSLLVSAAVLGWQGSNIVGDLGVGRAISKSRMRSDKQFDSIKNVMTSGSNREGLRLVEESVRTLESKISAIETHLENREEAGLAAESAGGFAELGEKLDLLNKKFSEIAQNKKDPANSKIPMEPETVIKEVTAKPLASAFPKSRRTILPTIDDDQAQTSERTSFAEGKVDRRALGVTGGEKCLIGSEDHNALPFPDQIPVAIIADDFTYYSFAPEFQLIRLTPGNWRSAFEEFQPKLFFCESAWKGGSSQARPWRGKVYASVNFPTENRTVLLEILDYCHKQGIPTVFWSKEDPVHFGDRIHDFTRTAALFDYVFTTAEECVPLYERDAGALSADVLPFAVQPRLFNPQGIKNAADSVNFAGTWYGQYPERCEAAATIMDQVLDAGLGLVIYDRMFGTKDSNYWFPERFRDFTKPAIPYFEVAKTYKESRFGITLNTVTDSRTMFARRAFELAASGAVVLSNTAAGMEEFFGDSVIYADQERTALQSLSGSKYRALQESAMKVALSNTYAHRAEKILRVAGIAHQSRFQTPSALAVVNTSEEYERAVENFQYHSVLSDLIVVLNQGQNSEEWGSVINTPVERVNVFSKQAVTDREFDLLKYVSPNGLISADGLMQWPTAGEITWLSAHSSHYDGAISRATYDDDKFSEGKVDSTSGMHLSISMFGDYVSNSGNNLTGFRV